MFGEEKDGVSYHVGRQHIQQNSVQSVSSLDSNHRTLS